MLKWYINEAIEPVLLCSSLNALLGITAAAYYGHANLFFGLLAIIGAVLAQISVDLLDDYFDFNSGIDKETEKTPFSGGSELMAKHSVKPLNVLLLGLACGIIGLIIGIYFAIMYPILIPLLIIGTLTVVLYTPLLVKIPFLGEPATMLNFVLIGVGSYIIAHGSTAGLSSAIYILVAAGILPGIALLVNIVPDIKVDKKFGRKTGVVMLEDKKKVSYYYLFWQLVSYLSVLIGIVTNSAPITLLALIFTVPTTLSIFKMISKYKDPQSFAKCMGTNIQNITIFTMLAILSYAIYLVKV